MSVGANSFRNLKEEGGEGREREERRHIIIIIWAEYQSSAFYTPSGRAPIYIDGDMEEIVINNL
jgi:hypothetical protein